MRAEAERAGLKFVGNSSGDWLPCRAIGRVDRNPSATLNCSDGPARGYYKDHGDGSSLNFFNLMAELGAFADWREARAYYAEAAGISLPGGAGEPKSNALVSASAASPKDYDGPDMPMESDLPASLWRTAGGRENIQSVEIHPYRGLGGRLLFAVARLKLKSVDSEKIIRPLRPKGGGWKREWELGLPKDCRGLPYRLPELLPADPAAPILVVDGERDVDRAAELGIPTTTNFGGADKWTDEDSEHLRDRHMVVFPDNDEAGRRHAAAVEQSLLKAGAASVRRLDLPDLPEKGDLSDWLDAGGTAEELRRLMVDAPLSNSATDNGVVGFGRMMVTVDTAEHLTIDQAVASLANHPKLFSRDGKLVRVIGTGKGNTGAETPRIQTLDVHSLRDVLTQTATFVERRNGGTAVPLHPPLWCVNGVLSRGDWPVLRPLNGIAPRPVLRRDGTVLNVAGYDESTGLYLSPRGVLESLPEAPERQDALAAAEELLTLVQDFLFTTPADRSAWLAAMLTPIARPAFRDPCPMFLAEALLPGSGKGLLFKIVMTIAFGGHPGDTPFAGGEELRKLITSRLLEGASAVVFDNLDRPLGGAALEAALTSEWWTDRVLKSNRTVRLRQSAVFYATGNDPVLSRDMSRRVVRIRLRNDGGRPEERSDFKQPYLMKYVREHQNRLLTAALTILRAYTVAGRPRPEGGAGGTLGSFEGWCRWVRDPIVWLGLPDPLDTRIAPRSDSERSSQMLRDLLDGLREADDGKGLTSKRIVELLRERPGTFASLERAVRELCDCHDRELPKALARPLGNRLRQLRSQICGSRSLDSRPVQKTARWFVRDHGEETAGGSGGSRGSTEDRENSHPPA